MAKSCIHCGSARMAKCIEGSRVCVDCGKPKFKEGKRHSSFMDNEESVNGHRRAFLGVGEMSDALIDHEISQLFKAPWQPRVMEEMAGVA